MSSFRARDGYSIQLWGGAQGAVTVEAHQNYTLDFCKYVRCANGAIVERRRGEMGTGGGKGHEVPSQTTRNKCDFCDMTKYFGGRKCALVAD